ncbi:hypothetical protein SODALDRAFT_293526 [Sodiomyces alkalinus F11]|uniref:Rta1 domain-containing protein n=1 Tax=Sodiomyces alkalinus (strain CBS 110278 / VKM F-3762 / F11) TaxID=1314773 RepID=A0A3N2PZX6_SODAK|nr:hypothetical protein SODALDRAFT_293526 [Sodiomyces alkalinus F11]ROT39915.1 hypothetical protein SODALDRAFT_293526 [Sodiomyces alkalinus F11]
MSHMSAKEFLAKAKSGEIPVDSHDRVLRIAFIYMDEGLWGTWDVERRMVRDNGVFSVVEQLHERGWSFGQGDLKFNRTLDIFYLAQIAAGTYRSIDQLHLEDSFPKPDDFDIFYARHRELLNQDAWKRYYSPTFLMSALSARFYRLPDLRDLPDSSDPLTAPREKGIGHFTKLPRWAYNVMRTHRRQATLPAETIKQIALSTLQETISRQREDYPDQVQPYSETQALFWLQYMNIDDPEAEIRRETWFPNQFGYVTAQGWYDMWAWEKHYSRKRWEESMGAVPFLERDLDGTRKSEIYWCGLPDGGTGAMAWHRGWDAELGSEEEIAFLAAVAAKETEGIDVSMSHLDYAMRSHMLLAVLRAAFETGTERGKYIDDVKRRIVEAGRIDEESKAEQWIRQALMVMEPYVHKRHDGWPAAVEDRGELLRQIVIENGQLFARWKVWPSCKEFKFELKSRVE